MQTAVARSIGSACIGTTSVELRSNSSWAGWVNSQLVRTTQRRRLGRVNHANLVCAKKPGGNHKTLVIGDLICIDGDVEVVMLPFTKHAFRRRESVGDSDGIPRSGLRNILCRCGELCRSYS